MISAHAALSNFAALLGPEAFADARRRGKVRRLTATAKAMQGLRQRKVETAARRRERARRANVPGKFVGLTLGRLERTAAMCAVDGIAGSRCLLVLVGPGDASKSTAAAAAVMLRGGLWVDAERLLDAWMTGNRQPLIDASVLVLDELARPGGTVDQRAAQAEAAEQLIHLRSQALQPTIVTSNYDRDVLRAWFNTGRGGVSVGERWERLRERLREHGVVCPLSAEANRGAWPELALLGGELLFSGFVRVPYEGLRDAARRADVLAGRRR